MLSDADGPAVSVINDQGASCVLLVCEHASNRVPQSLNGLGAGADVLDSHAAWDPGAKAVASGMSKLLDATLITTCFSRLVIDVNRPTNSPGSIVATSEVHSIPGNQTLTDPDRAERIEDIHRPFHNAIADRLDMRENAARRPVLANVHSFTPVYHGARRSTELGILFDDDDRLARILLDLAPQYTSLQASANAPYGPQDEVTYTLRRHALPRGIANAMFEIRSDFIETASDQEKIAEQLSALLRAAIAVLDGALMQAET